MIKLTEEQIFVIEQIISNGDRVEVFVTKEGVKILRVKRTTIETK